MGDDDFKVLVLLGVVVLGGLIVIAIAVAAGNSVPPPKPNGPMINVVFKDRIDNHHLPLEAISDRPETSKPVQLVSYDTAWLKVLLSDGQDLWINRDLVESWSEVAAATATSQAAQ
jgi:hypothetical protein